MEHLPQCITSNPTFAPVMHLLDDLDKYSRQLGSDHHRRSGHRILSPNFDLRELDDAFELHGEFAGVQRKELTIEFTEPQTLVVRGSIKRSYNTTDSSAAKKSYHDQEPTPAAAEPDKAKYWISERGIGEFSRTFSFPERVLQEGVTAQLEAGILSIHVPKANKHEKHSRRIEIA
ncbi:hsp20/alpha crystallin family protein [Hirsutella rhossiliensis]|uniref:Hsp20/alpha crystallin family domain-containing protein n=1 Tax=Hirsutella rhossiliensis TaxID=111463 RepID=A0A9P8N8M0_9HYPO|nr:hsp20/alpha crystallin family domain-containing protein [Hirsutella rhossiliensis]KAH0968739.1 hsp20/alpha crystallin family domain-containing protein [Hirsutella rhossiliensis]